MFNIIIRNANGNEIESFKSNINPIGASTVSTKNGIYEICEAAVDYVHSVINLYTESFTER